MNEGALPDVLLHGRVERTAPAVIARVPRPRRTRARRLLAEIAARLDVMAAAGRPLVELQGAQFLEAHEEFEARSDQRRRIVASLGALLARRARPGHPFRVLAVGCGSGMVDVPVTERIVRRLGGAARADVEYVGVNPNRTECDAFVDRFAAAETGASVSVFAGTFEEFDAAPARFDAIHFVHSLYYVRDTVEALHEAWRALAPGGSLVLFHAPHAELNQLAGLLYDRLYGRPTSFSDQLLEEIEAAGLTATCERIEARLDVRDILQGRSRARRLVRDFVLQVEGGHLDAGVLGAVEQYLAAVTEREYLGGGRAWLPHPVDRIVVEKPGSTG